VLWVDGKLRDASAPAFRANDRGATLGDSVFDTCLCLNGKVIWQEDHFERTMVSAQFFQHRFDPGILSEAYGLAGQSQEPSVLRVSINRGPGARGLELDASSSGQVTATLAPLPTGITFAPRTLTVASIRRNETSPASRHKTGTYLDAILAQSRARASGHDDAIFLNSSGNLACTTLANIFLVKGTILQTPVIASGTIPGITRLKIIEAAAEAGLEPVEKTLSFEDLGAADEVFSTNSLRLVMPAGNLGTGNGEATRHLAKVLKDKIKEEVGYQFTQDVVP